MRRRRLLLAGAVTLVGLTSRARSQTARVRRVAFFHPGTRAGFQPQLSGFRAGMREIGYVEGRDISIEIRAGENQQDQILKLAEDIVATRPDVIVTATSAAIAAFKKSTASIPIVFAAAYDPVGQHFVSSLRHPGGNVTGVLVHVALGPKIVEIIRDALPDAHRLATLIHEPDPAQRLALEVFEPAARRYKFEPIVVRVKRIEDLDRAFKEMVERDAQAALVENSSFQVTNRTNIVKKALAARLPLFSTSNLIVESGAVLSYGTLTEENWRRAAALVDKILRGASPADLPVDQPERFQLIVNRKTARAIGVELSPLVMARADRMIE